MLYIHKAEASNLLIHYSCHSLGRHPLKEFRKIRSIEGILLPAAPLKCHHTLTTLEELGMGSGWELKVTESQYSESQCDFVLLDVSDANAEHERQRGAQIWKNYI